MESQAASGTYFLSDSLPVREQKHFKFDNLTKKNSRAFCRRIWDGHFCLSILSEDLAPAAMSSTDKAELRQAILEAQAQIQQQTQQALAEKMSSICFKRCIPSPMEKLADRQRRCLEQCVGAYLEGFGVAVRFLLTCCWRSIFFTLPLSVAHPITHAAE